MTEHPEQIDITQDHIDAVLNAVRGDWTLMHEKGDPETFYEWLRAVQKITTTFMRKNKDYGSKNIGSSGVTGITVRLGDKVSRLWNLTLNKHTNLVNESVADTFLDVAAYGLIGYLLVSGLWPQDEIADSVGLPALLEYWVANNTLSDDDINRITGLLLAQGMVNDGFPGEVVIEK